MTPGQLGGGHVDEWPDTLVWRLAKDKECPADDADVLLDIAAYTDGRVDDDEREAVVILLAQPEIAAAIAADIAAARGLANSMPSVDPALVATVVARATDLVPSQPEKDSVGTVVPFRPTRRPGNKWRTHGWSGVAQWASLAAALLVASWLGFNLGNSASTQFGGTNQGDDLSMILRELFDPSTGLIRDVTEGLVYVTDAVGGAGSAFGLRRRWPIIFLALSLVLNLCFIAGAVWGRWHAPPDPRTRLQEVVRELALNPKQRDEFQSYVRTIRARTALMREQSEPLITSAWEELAKPQPDQARAMQFFDQVAEKRHAMLRETATDTANMLAALTPEQRAKFIAMWRQHRVPLLGPRQGPPA